MNRILFCHILLHGGSGHSTKCDLRGKRDPLQESTWGSAMRSKKKVLLRTRSGSGSCCCSLPGTVPACPAWWFRMQCLLWSHFTGGIWKTCEEKKKKKVFGKKKKIIYKLTHSSKCSLCLPLLLTSPKSPVYLCQDKTDKFWCVFPCMLNSPILSPVSCVYPQSLVTDLK